MTGLKSARPYDRTRTAFLLHCTVNAAYSGDSPTSDFSAAGTDIFRWPMLPDSFQVDQAGEETSKQCPARPPLSQERNS